MTPGFWPCWRWFQRPGPLIERLAPLGVTWPAEEAERTVQSKPVVINRMATVLGGWAAEELVFDEPSVGAADDLDRVGQIARMMVCQVGMSEQLGAVP